MPYQDASFYSVRGRYLGLQRPSTNATGGAALTHGFLAGPDAGVRVTSSTAASTATDIRPFGGSHYLPTSSAGSSQVYTIEPPIPGLPPTWIFGSTASEVYLKTKNSETFVTSGGSSFTTINPSSLGFCIGLVPLSTAVWGVTNGATAAGHAYTTST